MIPIRAEGNGLTSSDVPQGTITYVITAFISLALYNVIELNGFIFTTFKKRNGLYFWSMFVATWGVALNATGYLLKYLLTQSSSGLQALYTVLVLVGWSSMVTGQSVVLFSRLHLLVHDRFTIRFVLTMIVLDALMCHPPTFALFSLTNNQNDTQRFSVAYSIFEKFQLFIFFIQEFIISAIYILESKKFLKARKAMAPNSGRTGTTLDTSLTDRSKMVIYWLISVNVLVVLLDISILVLEFSGLYDLQTSWKAFVYSVKLKLEFSILNRLIGVVKARNPDLFDNAGNKLHVHSARSDTTNASGVKLTCRPSSMRPKPSRDDDVEKDSILPIQLLDDLVKAPSSTWASQPRSPTQPQAGSSRTSPRVPNFSTHYGV